MIFLITFAIDAYAQQPAPAAEDPRAQEARDLFEVAQQHYNEGRFLLAAQTFRRVHAMMVEERMPNAPMILYNIGRSLQMAPGHEAEARDTYQRFLNEADTENPTIRAQLANVQATLRELEARIASQAQEPDREEREEPEPAEPGLSVSPVGLAILGVGAAALIAGGAIGAAVLVRDDELTAMCSGGRCPSSSRDLAVEVESLALGADVLVAAGAAIAVTGLVLTFVLPGDEGSEDDVSVNASCGPLGCSLRVVGTF